MMARFVISRTGLKMLPFSPDDLDVVTTIALENTAGVTPHSVDTATSGSWVIATLQVTGPWECRVEIAVDAMLAEWLTKNMLDQEEVAADEVSDAVGEIANVIAGGVKGMTPAPGCGLTLPAVSVIDALPAPSGDHIRRFFTVMNLPLAISTSL